MNILLLQGPQGPFFSRLQKQFEEEGHNCWRVAFNGGDWIQSRFRRCIPYRDTLDNWQGWLRRCIETKKITHIFVYGDCRVYHAQAKIVCDELGIKFYAFEEGYIRPNYITLERDGVNANSGVCLEQVENWQMRPWRQVKEVKHGYYCWAVFAIVYYIAMSLMKPLFRHCHHHRNDSAAYDAFTHIRSAYRKVVFGFQQKKYWSVLQNNPFFLVPLQVSYDAQLQQHSKHASMEAFIKEIMASFASHGNAEDLLVFKHHPMDRGNNHYGKLIRRLAVQYGLVDRVVYIHDFNMPKLLKLAKGVVTINSTTSISAFHHGAPVKIVGRAFYDMQGLSDQKPLAQFWQAPERADTEFYLKLRNYLEYQNQINGNFYSLPGMTAGKIVSKMVEQEGTVISSGAGAPSSSGAVVGLYGAESGAHVLLMRDKSL